MDGWYYRLFDLQFGPVTVEKIVELIKDNTLSRSDEVRFGEKGNWRRLGSIGTFIAHLPFETNEELASERASVSRVVSVSGEVDDNLSGDLDFAATVSFAESLETQDEEVIPIAKKSSEVGMAESTSPPESEPGWFCMVQGKEYGPVTLPKMIEWAKAGRLRRDDQVRVGLDPCIRADELPGLFPEVKKTGIDSKPVSASASPESKTNSKVPLESSSTGTLANPTVPSVEKSPSESVQSSPNSPSTAAVQPSTGAPSRPVGVTALGGAAAKGVPGRPTLPIRKPLKKKSGGGNGVLAKLLPVGLGLGGLLLVGVLIYLGIMFMPVSTVDDAKRLQVLEKGFKDFQKLRDEDAKPTEDVLKAAQKEIKDATDKVKAELKKIENKNPNQTALNTLVTKMTLVSKIDKVKFDTGEPTKEEVAIKQEIPRLKKIFGPPP